MRGFLVLYNTIWEIYDISPFFQYQRYKSTSYLSSNKLFNLLKNKACTSVWSNGQNQKLQQIN